MAPWDDTDRQGSGGSIEYTLTITESKAGFTEYNEGNTCLLILEGEKEFSNGRVMDDGIWVNAPGGWSATEDGSFFVFEDEGEIDESARFDKRSKLQQFITSALAAGVPLEDRNESARDARGWAGLKLRIREEERSFKDRATGEARTFNQPLVVEFLGMTENSKPKKAVATKKEVAAETNGSGGEAAGDIVAEAKAIAAGCTDLIEYMDKVSKELGVGLDHPVCSASFFESAKA